jgi:hypothetical protein
MAFLLDSGVAGKTVHVWMGDEEKTDGQRIPDTDETPGRR